MKTVLQAAVACVLGVRAVAQGTFQNLDFEDATVAPTPVGTYGPDVPASAAFPGWTVGGSEPGGTGPFVLYNDETTGAPAVDLIGPAFPNALDISPLQGSYSVLLQYFGIPGIGFEPPTLSQTGMVPANAQSINFLSSPLPGFPDDGIVELNGVSIPLIPIAGGRLAGNISAWSGQTVQLTFTTQSTINEDNFFYFDDVTFSPATVTPEPDPLALIGIGGLVFALYRRIAQRVGWCCR